MPRVNEATGNKRLRRSLVVLCVLVVVVLAWLWRREPQRGATRASTEPRAPRISSPQAEIAPRPVVSESDKSGLQKAGAKLNAALEPNAARLLLTELHATLSALPANEAVAEIRRFLDSQADAPTRLGFKVAAGGGGLDEAPTLRTFLLDELARLDPLAAGDYAKAILASKNSPDEWALALRNLARGDPSTGGRALLEEKAGEMLEYEPWRQAPSVGFLEAFDVAVYLGGTRLLPTLAEMVRQTENPATAHASYLALDRLVVNEPASTLTALREAPEIMQGREQTRGNYFARADVRDPRQRQILENYLRDPQLSPVELDAFAGVFPNANFMISANLLTHNQTLDRTTLLARDAESLRVVQQWLVDPTLASRRPALAKMAARLQDFVDSANRSR